MRLIEARQYVRFLLGDQSESIWSDADIIGALNVSNKRIMARIVSENPEQYLMDFETYALFQVADADVAPLAIAGGEERVSFTQMVAARWGTEGAAITRMVSNPIKLVRLFYSFSPSLDDRTEIPLVPFSTLEERTEKTTLEYEAFSRGIAPRYKACYSAGTTMLYIRPVPSQTMYFKVYWAEAGVELLTPDADEDQRLLWPYIFVANDEEFLNLTNTPKTEAVCFDAAYILSFSDQSLRQAFAAERERILGTQNTPMSPSEAY